MAQPDLSSCRFQRPPNTEFSGEPAALPSLVRCNSLLDGALSKLATAVGYTRSGAAVRPRLILNASDKASKAGAVAAPGK